MQAKSDPSPEMLRIEFDDRILLDRGAISAVLDRRSTYTWSLVEILDGLDDFESNARWESSQWSATKTVFFKTDDGPHRLRVLVRTSPLAREDPAAP